MHLCNYIYCNVYCLFSFSSLTLLSIAMTTHCASRYQEVLKQISPRICIVEEAAEVNKRTTKNRFNLSVL